MDKSLAQSSSQLDGKRGTGEILHKVARCRVVGVMQGAVPLSRGPCATHHVPPINPQQKQSRTAHSELSQSRVSL